MKSLLCLVISMGLNWADAQPGLPTPDILHRRVIARSISREPIRSNRFRIPGKRASQYSPQDWGALIDSTWGPGQPAAEQLQIFDTFWNMIDQQWAGFPNIPLNWDSLRNVYRPQIGTGLSRGRFYALMSRMWLSLSETHTAITDLKVDTAYGYSTFRYRPGFPLLCTGAWLGAVFGAATTPLPDSTNLVYRILPQNPLGLEPGDLVLGYEGIPWKRLYRQLLDAGVPVSAGNSWVGSTPASLTYSFLMAVGYNWGMFDTVDIVKFSTGDTLHLPTAPLAALDTTIQNVWANDGVPIPGVPLPEDPYGPVAVSWGVVQGTSIGYVYVWDWASTQTRQLFQTAINDLVHTRHTTGLIIDSRMNWGGNFTYANGGLSQLFNFDPTMNISRAQRLLTTDHMSFSIGSTSNLYFTPGTLYDRPIALLIGPGSFSAGDFNPLRISYHPMVRVFGKPTNGAFVAGLYGQGTLSGGWEFSYPRNTMYTSHNGYLIHQGLVPDEEVWLTRAGVANGEDAVVKRALAWMDSLSYAHTISVSSDTMRTQGDSIHITAHVANPALHTLLVSAIETNGQGAVLDSVLLGSEPGDSVWGGFMRVPLSNGTYNISIRTSDVTAGSYRRLPNVASFTVMGTGAGEQAVILPREFSLDQNYPNPGNPSTNIRYGLPHTSFVTLTVYSTLGQQVARLVSEQQQAGYHDVVFRGEGLASGVYFYRLDAGSFTSVKKLLLLK